MLQRPGYNVKPALSSPAAAAPCMLQLPCLLTSALHHGLQEGMDLYNETYGFSENSGVGLHHKAGDRRWAVRGCQ